MTHPPASRSQSPTRITRPVLALLAASFCSSLSGFLVTPFLAVYLVNQGHLSPGMAGTYIGLMYWCLTGGGVFGGALADRWGVKPVMLLGILLRVPGYLLFLWADRDAALLAACIIVSLGGALFFPTSKAALVLLTTPVTRLRIFATRNMCANVGVAVGPLLGAGLLAVSPRLLFIVSGAIFAALAVLLAVVSLPKAAPHEQDIVPGRAASRLFTVPVISVCLVSLLFGLAYIHFESTVPLFLGAIGQAWFLPVMFTVNAVVVVAAQPVVAVLIRRLSARTCCVFGFICYGLGYSSFAAPGHVIWVWIAGVIVFSVGEVILSLLIDIRISVVSPTRSARVFGLSSLANAFGGLGGGYAGATALGSVPGGAGAGWLVLGPVNLVLGVVGALTLRPLDAPELTVDKEGDKAHGASM